MKAGSRVLIQGTQQLYYLGTVTLINGDVANVLLDKGATQTVKTDKLIQILYFDKALPGKLDTKWFKEHEKLIKPATFDIHTAFLSKKAQLCTLPLLTCMFYWANVHLFNKKLQLPKLGTNTRKRGLSGVFFYKENYLAVSPKTNVTSKEIFETFIHELVHCYQFNVEHKQEGTWDPASGGHGKSFRKWSGPIKEIAGVNLTQMHDLSSIEVEDAEDEGAKGGVFILLVSIAGNSKTYYFGCKNDKLESIEKAKKVIRAEYGMTAKYYTRVLSNKPLLNMICSCTNANGTVAKKVGSYYFSPLPESAFEQILKIAKPIE